LSNFLCRDSQDSKNFHHYLNNQVLHCLIQSHFNVDIETFEKAFNPVEYTNKRILARANIFSGLQTLWSDLSAPIKQSRKLRTMRKTPIPAKITFAGENTWDLTVRGHVINRTTCVDSLCQHPRLGLPKMHIEQ
jgi:hypothetical protein